MLEKKNDPEKEITDKMSKAGNSGNEEHKKKRDKNQQKVDDGQSSSKSFSSLDRHILWNISKAIEKKPSIQLKSAIKAAQEHLEQNANDMNAIVSLYHPEDHLTCALLAWKKLGHKDADSLYRFIEAHYNTDEGKTSEKPSENEMNSFKENDKSIQFNKTLKKKDLDYSSGPVVKLPTNANIVMRVENVPHNAPKKSALHEKQIIDKINEACCLESGCSKRLAELDTTTKELRQRASKLAKREAERVRLLERAEVAWRDLELGYQRRLTLAVEKEEDILRQTKKLIEERNCYKNDCLILGAQLKQRGDTIEKDRLRLNSVEKELCSRACERMKLMETLAKTDASLADNQCKAVQLDRDLQFKEEQARRKVFTLENELESMRALTFETERTMRSELNALREQISQVSKDLLKEDAANTLIKQELDDLRQEKNGMLQDLEGCKAMCDGHMKNKLDELKKKKDELNKLMEAILECRCKIPIDEEVEVKRTPSIAALCGCAPEDKVLETCSCTSIRSRLLSTMLADLFGGLQTELGITGLDMPCQLLKCLEDKHNWDRGSVVKTNLRNFFSKLLTGELDIAIATSIEKYHAKWVGASCADNLRKLYPDTADFESDNEGWQKRAIERQAQKLATQLAEQMFQEKAEQLAERAKSIAITTGQPPCECNEADTKLSPKAMYSCLVDPLSIASMNHHGLYTGRSNNSDSARHSRHHSHDVSLLRAEIENLKKGIIKKADLSNMQKEIAKIVQLASNASDEVISVTKDMDSVEEMTIKDNIKSRRTLQPDHMRLYSGYNNKLNSKKKKSFDVSYSKNSNKNVYNQTGTTSKQQNKIYKRPGQSFAVNLCLCGSKDPNKIRQGKIVETSATKEESKMAWKRRSSRETLHQISSIRHTKPIAPLSHQENKISTLGKISARESCKSDGICFHKVPSNSSIDELLRTLTKWKCDLNGQLSEKSNKIQNSVSLVITEVDEAMKDINSSRMKYGFNPSQTNKTDISKRNSSKKSNNETIVSYNISSQIEERIAVVERPLAISTESEYMGAVNLDKSNENFCRCVIGHERGENFPFECIKSCNCPLKAIDLHDEAKKEIQIAKEKKSLPHRNQSDRDSKNLKKISNYRNNKDEDDKKGSLYQNPLIDIKNRKEFMTVLDTNIVKSLINKAQNTSLSDFNNIDSSTFPYNCDYNIEFLGVTLTNAYLSENATIEKPASQAKGDKIGEPADESIHNNEKVSCNTCQCNGKIDELKNLLNNVFTKQSGDSNINKDKALDTQSLKEWEEPEPCVCCNNDDMVQSDDLELNTFHLLQEHFKEKLEDFKLNNTSSCIPPNEEEKLFSALLKKIKNVIVDSTTKVTCQCTLEHQTEGSWNRAYTLLQEYLKTKIKRVQCMCDLPQENKKTILPDVTNKVCDLIENDFQRLKNIYKCKNISKTCQKINSIEETIYEEPEKDTNSSDKRIVNESVLEAINNDTVCELKTNTFTIITQTISSQVPPNLGMETKSCNVIQKGSKCMQTAEPGVKNKSNLFTEFKSCDCCTVGVNEACAEPVTQNEVMAYQCTKNDATKPKTDEKEKKNPIEYDLIDVTDLIDKRDVKSHEEQKIIDIDLTYKDTSSISVLPYIGYTVECSCDPNLIDNCACAKSMVTENTKKIKNIWETVTSSQPKNKNASYILENVNKKHVGIDIHQLTENKPTETESLSKIDINHFCATNTSAHYNPEIVLKDSMLNNKYSSKDITTNTFNMDPVLKETDYISEDPIEWYECKSTPLDELYVRKFKSVHFPIEDSFKHVKRESSAMDHNSKLPCSLPRDCACNMVPICHVKMLMENIENKLVHAECTCDSLCSKVCPIHADKSVC